MRLEPRSRIRGFVATLVTVHGGEAIVGASQFALSHSSVELTHGLLALWLGLRPSERSSLESERPNVIITDDINCLLQYPHGLEGNRQRDNQGVQDHLGDIQNELRGLAD
jgi:hypothetical protein